MYAPGSLQAAKRAGAALDPALAAGEAGRER
jgi:hypothetical protein